jgi:hypothetical protein
MVSTPGGTCHITQYHIPDNHTNILQYGGHASFASGSAFIWSSCLALGQKCECETHPFPNLWDPFASDSKLLKSITPKSKNGYTCLTTNHMVKQALFFRPTSRVQTNRTQFTIRSKQASKNMFAHLPETLQTSTFYPSSKCNIMMPGTILHFR